MRIIIIMKILLSSGDSGVLQTIENRKLSYQGNIEVVMCLQCCMNGAGAPPIWKIYDGGISFTSHKEAAELYSSQGIPTRALTASPLTYFVPDCHMNFKRFLWYLTQLSIVLQNSVNFL